MSNTHRPNAKRFFSVAAALFVAVFSSIAIPASHAALPVNAIANPRALTEGHVYLYKPTPQPPEDVTNRTFTNGSQSYIYYAPNNVIPVTLNYTEGHVYNMQNQLIGFIVVP
jgi:hypothetical protein